MTFSDPDVPSTSVGIQIQALLERGHPGEILPAQLPPIRAAAEAYVKDNKNPPDARERVHTVWIKGKYLPSWQAYTPRKDKPGDFG